MDTAKSQEQRQDLSEYSLSQLDNAYAALPINSPWKEIFAAEIERRVDQGLLKGEDEDEDEQENENDEQDIEKALNFFLSGSDVLEKAERGKPIGTISTHGGKKVIKTAQGWKPYAKGGSVSSKDDASKKSKANKDQKSSKGSKDNKQGNKKLSDYHESIRSYINQEKQGHDGKSWAGTGEMADLHGALAEEYNDLVEITGKGQKYTAHEGYSKSSQEAMDRHHKGISDLLDKLPPDRVKQVHDDYEDWLGDHAVGKKQKEQSKEDQAQSKDKQQEDTKAKSADKKGPSKKQWREHYNNMSVAIAQGLRDNVISKNDAMKLRTLREYILEKDLEGAMNYASSSLDTHLREQIPNETWQLMGGKLVKDM